MKKPKLETAQFVMALFVFVAFWWLALNGKIPVPHPAVEPSACKTAQECQENSPLSRFWDWLFHDATSFFTFVLAIFTGALVWVAARADGTARTVADVAKRQMLISGQQTDILEKQKEIQRQEFLITHRPRIRFRTINFIPTEGNSQFRAQFVNIGSTDARILSTQLAVFIETELGALESLAETGRQDEDTTLGMGNTRWITLNIAETGTVKERASRKIIITAAVLYAEGRNRVLATSMGRRNTPPSIRMNGSDGLEDMNWED